MTMPHPHVGVPDSVRGHRRPGKPLDNADIEAFSGRVRDGRLNSRWFESVDDARQALQA